MQALYDALITEIERLSLECSFVSWHSAGAVLGWSRCRVGGRSAFEVALDTGRGEMVLTVLPRGERWCVLMPDALLVEDRFPRVVEALRLLIARGDTMASESAAVH